MNTTSTISFDNNTSDERKTTPPAFLDLADSVSTGFLSRHRQHYLTLSLKAARLGSNLPDMSAVSRGFLTVDILVLSLTAC